MPPRKPSGAATSSEMRMIGGVSRIGCQLPHHRSRTTMPKPIAAKSTLIHAARIQPAPRSSRRALPRVGGSGACVRWSAVAAVTSSVSPLLARLDQILDERVELVLGQLEGRHDVLRKALLDIRVRVRDRLLDEVRDRLPGALGIRRQLVEIGPDLA